MVHSNGRTTATTSIYQEIRQLVNIAIAGETGTEPNTSETTIRESKQRKPNYSKSEIAERLLLAGTKDKSLLKIINQLLEVENDYGKLEPE